MTTQSETPRVDENVRLVRFYPQRIGLDDAVHADFARQLERDLASANQRIAFLESVEGGQIEQENKALKRELAEKEAMVVGMRRCVNCKNDLNECCPFDWDSSCVNYSKWEGSC